MPPTSSVTCNTAMRDVVAVDGHSSLPSKRDLGDTLTARCVPGVCRGIGDTIRMQLCRGIDARDIARLVDRGFNRLPAGPGRTLKGVFYPPAVLFVRADGARVITKSGYTAVEFSAPRVLLGCNTRVAEVAPWALVALVREMTDLLLPRTTVAARRAGERWSVQRLDLAVDFPGPVWPYLDAYRLARTPRVRREAVLVGSSSLYWRATRRWSSMFIVLYDKAAEVAARRRSPGNRGRPLPPVLDPTGRLEVRLLNARCRGYLTSCLEQCPEGEGLPFCKRLGAPVVWYRVDYERMHAFVRGEVERLEGRPLPERVRVRETERRTLVGRISHAPGRLLLVRDARQREALRREAFALALSRLGTRLSGVCWSGEGTASRSVG